MSGLKRKRYRVFEAKPGQLLARYGRAEHWDEPDLCYAWGDRHIKPDSRMLMMAFEQVPVFEGKTLRQELEARGYDITTLRFSIEQKATPTPTPGGLAEGERS
ncbi:hypothetical protein PUR23_19930 [Methylorubrum populi]|uniref:hypothetical protein n=1 Tax=Methylorubrum populi TaxID=223967 RepID=UPI0031F89DDB